MRVIFGARTEEMLRILAAYRGEHEQARYAKKEASQWLAELSSESPPTPPAEARNGRT
jgi:hypothetical protein